MLLQNAPLAAAALLAMAGGGEDGRRFNASGNTAASMDLGLGLDLDLNLERWPVVHSEVARSAELEAMVDSLLSRMTLREKVGQMVMADTRYITPEEAGRYKIGSVLSSGDSFPYDDRRAAPSKYRRLAREFRSALEAAGNSSGVRVPMLWATDAVHGHGHVRGAVLFPHNAGLGATRDPDLVERIGEATARMLRATGIQWNFAPCVAVARDLRWGRAYESFSEDPELVRALAGAAVRGLQGRAAADGSRNGGETAGGAFLGPSRAIATAKHFLGDGGTLGGRDRGDTRLGEAGLVRTHAPGHVAALAAGAQAVMASFSSWNGSRVHGSRYLLAGALKGRLGFDGVVVGDYDGHAALPGCGSGSCAAAFNAGVDVVMAPEAWREMLTSTEAQARAGEIPMARVDDAVRRVLRVKARAGLLDPAAYKWQMAPLAALEAEDEKDGERSGEEQEEGGGGGGLDEDLRSPAVVKLAREAVRKSLVLLKNRGGVLPIRGSARVLVAGPGADSVPMQAGGWSVTWQGDGTANADFPGATTVGEGLRQALEESGGSVVEPRFNASGGLANTNPDVAVVVFGERPYAEFEGDRKDSLELKDSDTKAMMRVLKDRGVPIVAVLLSGRPLFVRDFLAMSDAFVAAFLPGTEGQGVADMLVGDMDGNPRYPFTGRLPFSWPKSPKPERRGDAYYKPLFEVGYRWGGLTN